MLLLETKSLQPLLGNFIFVTWFLQRLNLNQMAEIDEDKYCAFHTLFTCRPLSPLGTLDMALSNNWPFQWWFQEAFREEQLINRLMRQSQQERRIAVQLMHVRHEKEVLWQNRIFREKQYEERRLKDFQDALDREAVSNISLKTIFLRLLLILLPSQGKQIFI